MQHVYIGQGEGDGAVVLSISVVLSRRYCVSMVPIFAKRQNCSKFMMLLQLKLLSLQ